MRQLLEFKKACDSVRKEVLYNILIEFRIPMKLVKTIKMCLKEKYRRVRVGKNLCDTFPIRIALKQRDVFSPLIFNFALDYAIRRVQENQDDLRLNGTRWLILMMLIPILGGSLRSVKSVAVVFSCSRSLKTHK